MFYVKSNFGCTDVITELHCDNIFTRCPKCGGELNVDLAEVFLDGDADLESTSIICSACTEKRCKGDNHGLQKFRRLPRPDSI